MPPPAEGFTARLVLGPALRTQPDRRLVALVRSGYETAFEEIVRRYGKPLIRYAAAIVGGRAEDVTQDAFSKALLALRREGVEIELRPWLFRIVRNTALNDLRDSPPTAAELAETTAAGANPAEELERREELTDLIERLRSLPVAQRAAIVMREMEGLSHDEIAAALGLSGGAARQAIYRARQTLRDGLGMLLPVPLLRALLDGSATAPMEATAGAAAVGGAAGTGVALKAAAATVLLAGAVGTGVAVHDTQQGRPSPEVRSEQALADDSAAPRAPAAPLKASDDRGHGDHFRRQEGGGLGDDHGHGSGGNSGPGGPGTGGGGPGRDGHRGGAGVEASGDGGRRGPSGDDHSGGDHHSTSDGSGRSHGGSSSSDDGGHSGDGSSADDSGSGSGDGSTSGSDDGSTTSEGIESDGSGSGVSGSDSSVSGSGGDEPNLDGSGDSRGGDGLSVQTEPQL